MTADARETSHGSRGYFWVQVGIEEEGLTDVMSGLLSGSFSLGGGAGPILGGLLAAWFGFQWAAAAFGLVQLVTVLAVAVVSVRVAGKARSEQELVRATAAELAREQQNGGGEPGASAARHRSPERQRRRKEVVTPRGLSRGRLSGQWQHSDRNDALRHPLLTPPTRPQDNA